MQKIISSEEYYLAELWNELYGKTVCTRKTTDKGDVFWFDNKNNPISIPELLVFIEERFQKYLTYNQ